LIFQKEEDGNQILGEHEIMQIQLIRNATLRMTYGDHIFITDPYFASKHSQDPLIGKSRNPTADLPFSVENILADIEMIIVSHLHPDHFDDLAQQLLPKNIQVYCQPGDEREIKEAGFSKVSIVEKEVDWHGVKITRTPGQHGNEGWAAQMGNVSGFVFQAENERTIYWTGDTIWCEPVKKVILEMKPDIIITHSSGASFEDGNPIIMDAQQTIEVCRATPRSTVIAIHMETFDFDTVSREGLRAVAEAEGIEASQLLIPGDGETLAF
jgi:L-ascorbate metabolism protein UlaG (beta-lactamase superfamily)